MQAIVEVKQADIVVEQGVNINALLDKWALYLDATPHTFRAYISNVRLFFQWLAIHGITNPTREDVIAYRDELEAEGKKANTINAYRMALKQFFTWTAQEGLYPNITEGVRRKRVDRDYKKDYLTGRQAGKVLGHINTNTVQGLRDYAICALMLTTGLRTVSIVQANIEDIRPLGEQVALYYQGKGHDEKAKCVKISEQVEDAIRAYLAARGKVSSNSPLFASLDHKNKGGRMTTRSISRIAKLALEGAGYNSDKLTAHSFRHTAGTLALKAGAKLAEVQQMLAHADISTTMMYVHAIEREENNAELLAAGAIFKA